jgi:predicted  nucleic acid-binding Zn-ribbon protein
VVEGLQQLIELQQLDDELLAAEQEHGGLPARRQELAERREAAENEREAAAQALHEAEAEQRRAEVDVQDKQALKQKLESQQFQVKTNEAYTALLHEIEQAGEGVSEGETRVLEAMEAIDSARERLSQAEKQAEATLAGVAEQERVTDLREKELDARIAQLRGSREALCQELDAELLAQYQRIASRRRPAIARVRDEMCLGCRIHLPPQQQIELMRGEVLITCSRCHRILIPPDRVEAAK